MTAMYHTDLAALAAQVQNRTLPPLANWNPPLCGDMPLRIDHDGHWWHDGTLIEREALARLFATVLRREDDGHYYLVTPVEKWRIEVEDAPFLAVLLDIEGSGEQQRLIFTTRFGDTAVAGPDHPITLDERADGQPAPYIHIRDRLQALMSRGVFLQLAEQAVIRQHNDGNWYGVWSEGVFFPLQRVDAD